MSTKTKRDRVLLGSQEIPVGRLRPHPLNANKMTPETRSKLLTHIKATDRYPHVIVRPHPKRKGAFQVLDGHNRVDVLHELGVRKVRCDVWNVNDRDAKILLATLNRLEGQDVPLERAKLVHELLGEMPLDDLAGLLPEDGRQLEDLHSLLEFPADEVAELLESQAEAEEKVLPRVVAFVLTPEQEQLVEGAVERASDGKRGRDRRARGLANLAKSFLGEHDEETHSKA